MAAAIQCRSCTAILVQHFDRICFYQDHQGGVHLTIKPEFKEEVFESTISQFRESAKKVRAVCMKCHANLGFDVPFGPLGRWFTAFGPDKVLLSGRAFSKRSKWSACNQPGIDHRTDSTLFGSNPETSSNESSRLQSQPIALCFPDSNDVSSFLVSDLVVSGAEAKEPQLRAYIEACLGNLILMMPTGYGKTFVGALVMARFRQLNSSHLVAFVVDRIPLVYQQADAIEGLTGLQLCRMCGESRTTGLIRRLVAGADFDGVVCTAGTLWHELSARGSNPLLRASDFSAVVLDECHHATGGHTYAKILQILTSLPVALRPRILGMSASPFTVSDANPLQHGCNLLKQFDGAPVYRPDLPPSPQCDEFLEVDEPSACHRSFLQRINHAVFSAVESINSLQPGALDAEHYQRNLALFKGDLRSVLDIFQHDSSTEQDRKRAAYVTSRIWALIESALVAELVSLHAAEEVLATRNIRLDHAGTLPQEMPQDRQSMTSPIFACLLKILRGSSPREAPYLQEKQAIVFVNTRSGAKAVHRELNRREFKTGLMLGHGGYDGMDWHGDGQQKATVEQFRTKQISILVSTSVVEEGLDIPSCDVVIRLCCSGLTLLSYVQGRGRARLSGSRHIVVGTHAQRESVARLQEKERLLKGVVNELQYHSRRQVPSAEGRQLFARVTGAEEVISQQRARHSTDSEGAHNPSKRLSFEIVIPPEVVRSPSSVRAELERAILRGTGGLLAVSSFCLSTGRACEHFGVTGLFGPKHTVALCELGLAAGKSAALLCSDDGEWLDAYEFLACNWDFCVAGAVVHSMRYQARADSETVASHASQTLGSRRESHRTCSSQLTAIVSGGHFLSSSHFVEQFGSSGENLHATVTINQDEITFSAEIKKPALSVSETDVMGSYQSSKIRIPFPSLVGFCISSSPRVNFGFGARSVQLYFPITASVVCTDEWLFGDADVSVRITACDTAKGHPLAGLLSCRVLCVSFDDIKSESAIAFRREWMTREQTRSFRIFDTAVCCSQASPNSLFQSFQEDSPVSCFSESSSTSDEFDSDSSLDPRGGSCSDTHSSRGDPERSYGDSDCVIALGNQLVSLWMCLSILGSWQYVATPRTATDLVAAVLYSQKAECVKVQALRAMEFEVKNACLDSYFTRAAADLKVRFHEICAAMNPQCTGHNGASEPLVEMPSVFVTPGRFMVGPPVPIKTNRLLRLWMPKCRFVSVHFRDENGQRLFGSREINQRIAHVMQEGFTLKEAAGDLSACWDNDSALSEVMSTRFRFVCCSASQLREQNAIFTDGDVNEIRTSLVPDYASKDAAKQMSSLGLFCTADWPTIRIPAACREPLLDIENVEEEGGHCLTDGAGLLGRDLAEEVAACLAGTPVDSSESCALQVRYAGMKGVLTVSPANRHLHTLAFRGSMRKCDAPDDTLCVVKAAKASGLRLNREVITLLEALALRSPQFPWSEEIVSSLLGLQEKFLSSLALMFIAPTEARAALARHLPRSDVDSLISERLDPLAEPYWRSLLQTIHRREIRNIRSKTHIPVEQGRLLMGIPDPLGVLGPGEVFCRIQDPLISRGGGTQAASVWRTITGNVLVYRNPCLNPGDLQVLSAVNNTALQRAGLCNVVVFSVNLHGAATAHDCSGGDLDGDCFAVVWDHGLVPPREVLVPPLNYDALAADNKLKAAENEKLSPTTTPIRLESYFLEVFDSSARLGKLAHLHLALCDQVEGGACNSLAVEVSKAQSIAVDFPKTGVQPTVPEECLKIIGKSGYPDFMEKSAKVSYVSDKVLGVLYSRCKSLSDELLDSLVSASDLHSSPLALGVEAFLQKPDQNRSLVDRFRGKARGEMERFKDDVKAAMARFGLKRAGELWLVLPFRWTHPLHAANKEQAASSLRHTAHSLQRKYLAVFNRDSLVRSEDDMLIKAAVWYSVSQERGRENNGAAVSGFGWIAKNAMARVCQAVSDPTAGRMGSCETSIGRRALDLLQKDLLPRLHGTVESRRKVAETVKDCLKASGLHAYIFGSVALGLAEPDSDIDLFVCKTETPFAALWSTKPQAHEQRTLLSTVVSGAIDSIVDSKREILTTVVPIITCSIAETNIDFCVCPDGIFKADVILKLYRANPCFFALFALVTHWARRVGLIKHPGGRISQVGTETTRRTNVTTTQAETDGAVLKSGELHAVILFVMSGEAEGAMQAEGDRAGIEGRVSGGEQRGSVIISGAVGSSFIEEMVSGNREGLNAHTVGEFLLAFLDRASRLRGDVRYIWPVPQPPPPSPQHTIAAEQIEILAATCRTALHLLAASQSFEIAMNIQQQASVGGQMTKLLSYGVSRLLASASDWHARRLSVKTGADVRLEKTEGKVRISVEATGSQVSLERLRIELERLQEEQRLAIGGYLSDRVDLRFMQGCTNILVPGPIPDRGSAHGTLSAVQLKFRPFDGDCNARHRLSALFAAQPAASPDLSEAGSDTPTPWTRVRSVALECSARLWRQCQRCPDHHTSSMSLTFHFGNFYLMKMAESGLLEGSATMTCEELEQAISKGRRNRTSAAQEEFSLDRVSDARSKNSNPRLSEDEEQQQRDATKSAKVPIQTGGNASHNADGRSFVKERSKARKNERHSVRISAGFCPTIGLKSKRRVMTKSEIDAVLGSAAQILSCCGFVEKLDADPLREVCKVTVKVSSSYSAVGSFAQSQRSPGSLQLLELREGELKWYHGTILSGAMSEASAVRIKLQTEPMVSYSSDLFLAVMGDNRCTPPIFFKPNSSEPCIAQHVSQGPKARGGCVVYVRSIYQRRLFTGPAGLQAALTHWEEFSGENLKRKDNNITLSMQAPHAIMNALKQGSEASLAQWLEQALAAADEVIDGLTEAMLQQ